MTASLDSEDLERTFTYIETFLATFPKDPNVENASLGLVAAIFKAVEDAIGFFVESDSALNHPKRPRYRMPA